MQQGRSCPGEGLGYIQSALHLKMKKKMGKKNPQLLPFCAVKINILSPSSTAQADGEYFLPAEITSEKQTFNISNLSLKLRLNYILFEGIENTLVNIINAFRWF